MRSHILLFIFFLTIATTTAFGGSSGLITFDFEDHSLFPGNLQIRDEICKPSKISICNNSNAIIDSSECQQNPALNKCVQSLDDALKACPCKEAGIKLRSSECRGTTSSVECIKAKNLASSAQCIPGLIYEGPAGKSVKLKLSVCKSSGGYGNVSVRDTSKSSEWTNYTLIDDGDTITFP